MTSLDMQLDIKRKRLFMLDMDGTIYLGDKLFEQTIPFLECITAIGAQYVFLTNNSSKSTAVYKQKLAKMGIFAEDWQIITSSKVTAAYLVEMYGKQAIYALGTTAFCEELRAFGLNLVDSDNHDIAALVMGFDTELTFDKLHDASILLTRSRGVDYIATNCDLVCPTEFGSVPDCGSVAQMLENATGRTPLFMGKPDPRIVRMALEITDTSAADAVLIGDRLYTDIACGIAAGVDTALVLSGEAKCEDIAASPHKPTYVFENVGRILDE